MVPAIQSKLRRRRGQSRLRMRPLCAGQVGVRVAMDKREDGIDGKNFQIII